MERFSKAFRRNADGSWTCIQDATFQGPDRQIRVAIGMIFRPGEAFMTVDIAKWLEEYSTKRIVPRDWHSV